jgi:hypothetical protein
MDENTTGYRNGRLSDAATPLYRQVLGAAFDTLPPRLQAVHQGIVAQQWRGVADVQRGGGWAARLAATLFGFPKAARDIPVTLTFSPAPGSERWTRRFGATTLSSVQWAHHVGDHPVVMERFGLATFALALVIEDDKLFFIPTRWSLAGIAMPCALLPSGRSFETQQGDAFCFDIEVNMPMIGRIVSYKGRLWPCQVPGANEDQ